MNKYLGHIQGKTFHHINAENAILLNGKGLNDCQKFQIEENANENCSLSLTRN